jgi:hypothetical protein
MSFHWPNYRNCCLNRSLTQSLRATTQKKKITWSSVRAEPEGRREQERARKIDDLMDTVTNLIF